MNQMVDNEDDDITNEDYNTKESAEERYNEREMFDAIDMDGKMDYEDKR